MLGRKTLSTVLMSLSVCFVASPISAQTPECPIIGDSFSADTSVLSTSADTVEIGAPEPGATKAFVKATPFHACGGSFDRVHWYANTVGWKRGRITIVAKLYWNGQYVDEMRNSCGTARHHVSSCSTPSRTDIFFPSQGSYDVYATGCGPGGCDPDSDHDGPLSL